MKDYKRKSVDSQHRHINFFFFLAQSVWYLYIIIFNTTCENKNLHLVLQIACGILGLETGFFICV